MKTTEDILKATSSNLYHAGFWNTMKMNPNANANLDGGLDSTTGAYFFPEGSEKELRDEISKCAH